MVSHFTPDGVIWSDGRREKVDTVIFATGYRPHLPYLARPGALDAAGRVLQRRGISTTVSGLYFVGLPRQRNVASATLRGVGADARIVVNQLRRDRRLEQRSRVKALAGWPTAPQISQWRSRSSELLGLMSLITRAARKQWAAGKLPVPRLVGAAMARSAIIGAGFLGFGHAASLYSPS
jgi:hypothetical protein